MTSPRQLHDSTPSLALLARPGGGFAMVAMDQRESLRQMVTAATGRRPHDGELTSFKQVVARELGAYASGFLVDTAFGFERVAADGLPPTCGLIVAADRLHQEPDGPVEDTAIDGSVDLRRARTAGAIAAKLLVIWRDDDDRDRRIRMSAEFVRRCRDDGLLSVLEGVARPGGDGVSPILAAARDLAGVQPDLYKAQVPLAGKGDVDRLTEECAKLDAVIAVPWVVLSQGVDRADFATAVRAACRAGASGMLAGRAIWSDLVGAAGELATLAALLRERSVPRLRELGSIVDSEGTPWHESR
jgi:sulfofructosephosphate aldolase